MSALKLFCDIIQREMGLADDQVILWNQKFNIPSDERLYISVGVLSQKIFANNRRMEDDGITETLSTNVQATLDINVYSRSADARDRKEEVILALNSTYSQQVQQANSFYIAPNSTSFVNLSEIDGAAIPYRFHISCVVQYFVTKSKVVDYYDQFPDPKFDILMED